MTLPERPDISSLPEEVKRYIEALEAAVTGAGPQERPPATSVTPAEPPTTINVITISRQATAKRTPRHHYERQRRGGMGVFDVELPAPDMPALVTLADEEQTLLLFTQKGRVFRLPVSAVTETAVRGRGSNLRERLPLHDDELLVAGLPDGGGVYVALASERGWVRRVRSSFFGRSLIPGMKVHDMGEGGALAAACWTRGEEDLFMVTRQGQAIRFRETQVPNRSGCLGLRVAQGDGVTAITAVNEQTGVFLASSDGKGTIRLMSGFRANKAPGAGGKIAIRADEVVGAAAVGRGDDIFLISRLSKIIRFSAEDVPAKDGVVQGVNAMNLRADAATALAVAHDAVA